MLELSERLRWVLCKNKILTLECGLGFQPNKIVNEMSVGRTCPTKTLEEGYTPHP